MQWKRIRNYLLILMVLCFSFLSIPQVALAENIQKYDVVVVGGEPEGIAAALSASRNGAKTLLLTEDKLLGGTMTVANLTNIDMNYGPNRELLTKGIFEEFFHWVKGDSFDVKRARKAFVSLTQEEKNLGVMLDTRVEKPILNNDGKTLTALEISEKGKKIIVYGKRFIDATADADLAALCQVPYTVGREDMGMGKKVMAPTLIFQVGGVNWGEICAFVRKDKSHLSGANSVSAWGYGQEMRGYRPQEPEVKVRGLNISRQDDGSVLINALLIFDVNPLDPISVKNGMIRGKKEVKRIVEYLRAKAPGFEKSYLMGAADKLYIRESRHIKGEYQLTIDDVLESKNFPDKIAVGSYPVDVQAASKEETGYVIGVTPIYSIPFRCLVPLKVDNLLVVGRSASFTSLAAGSARVIPVGMVEGQSAGLAAIYSIHRNLNFHQLSKKPEEIAKLQERLELQGVYLPNFYIQPNKESKEWTYPYMLSMRKRGLVALGSYKNDYQLTYPAKSSHFVAMLRRALGTLPVRIDNLEERKKMVRTTLTPLTYPEAMKILNEVRVSYLKKVGSNREIKESIAIPQEIQKRFLTEERGENKRILTKGEEYVLMHFFCEQIKRDLEGSKIKD